MKILFVNGPYPFCYYYRGYLPGVYSNQMVVSDFMRKDMKVDPVKLKEQAMQADVIVFQRPSDKRYADLARMLKLAGKKIIFENDDTYMGIPIERLDNERQREIAREQAGNLNKVLEIADGAIASTEFLAEEFRKINPNVAVLKNCVDPLDEMSCKPNTTGKFRVGLIGSVTTNDDYKHIKDQIRVLDERGDITFVVMGVKYKDGSHLPVMQEDYDFWNSLKNVEWHPYCHVTEYMMKISQLALDVAIIPREESYFNRCKSNLKFLEMSLLGIPVIAQGFGDGSSPYQGSDEKYLTIVRDNSCWSEYILHAKNNIDVFKEKAQEAKAYVLENYNIKNYAQEWVNQIKMLCK